MSNDNMPKRKVHFFLNSKGGVGKSHFAVILAQKLLAAGEPVRCFDADATSATFSSFPALKVMRFPLVVNDKFQPRVFDEMTEPALTEDSHFVIDTGASSFVYLNSYFLTNDIPAAIAAAGKTLVANLVIVGGTMFADTCNNLERMVEQMPEDVQIAVWLNEHFGPIRSGGKEFEEMDIFQRCRRRIAALVQIPDWTYSDQATFGEDVQLMMKMGLTFEEAQRSPEFALMAKSRLARIRADLFAKLEAVI